MSAEDFNKAFAKRLRFYLDQYDMTQRELAQRLHVGDTAVYNWLHGIKTPRMDKVDAMCQIFHCNRSDLIAPENQPEYYLDRDAREAAEFLFHNPEYKVLFDASRKVKKEDIDFVAKMLDRMKGDNNDTDD